MRLILILVLCALCGCRENILHNLSEQEANRAFVVLARAGIGAEKILEPNGWSLAVAKNEVASALTALDQSRVFSVNSPQAVTSQPSLFQSREEREAAIHRLLESQLEESLVRFGGVIEARVHLHLQSQRTLAVARPAADKSASVLLVVSGAADSVEPQVRRLVAGATSLEEQQITVVLTHRDTQAAASEVLPPESNVAENRFAPAALATVTPVTEAPVTGAPAAMAPAAMKAAAAAERSLQARALQLFERWQAQPVLGLGIAMWIGLFTLALGIRRQRKRNVERVLEKLRTRTVSASVTAPYAEEVST